MKLYLFTLTLSLLALYTFIKRSYTYASVQDEVEAPNSFQGLKQGDVYKDKCGNQVMLTSQAPIDYEDTQAYKDSEPWFSGMGRC
ncbi:hypothetical protein [Mammaliicoccus sciuri]|uniref:hypothetical protein n=1 Tax=Mammaliicoccus sciuri TaxID=1296 RepID=UPI000E6A1C54|nr:hypothetical protein [Mammaliicoccus sciuri]RIN80225.1 hypothetical protein BU007_07790 [Mammaliicoccus sciuri]